MLSWYCSSHIYPVLTGRGGLYWFPLRKMGWMGDYWGDCNCVEYPFACLLLVFVLFRQHLRRLPSGFFSYPWNEIASLGLLKSPHIGVLQSITLSPPQSLPLLKDVLLSKNTRSLLSGACLWVTFTFFSLSAVLSIQLSDNFPPSQGYQWTQLVMLCRGARHLGQ